MTDAQLRAHEAKQLRKVAAFIRQYVEDHASAFGIKRDVWLSVAERKVALAEALEMSLEAV